MEKLFNKFVGDLVTIIMSDVTTAVTMETGEQAQINLAAIGYLLDFDEEFLYLGKTPEKVTEAIKRTNVARVSLYEEDVDSFYSAGGESVPEDEWN